MIAAKKQSIPADFDISQTSAEVCEKCGGESFIQSLLLRKVSALLTETGKEGYLPVQVFSCASCGHVNQHFIPEELRAKSPIVTS